MDFHFLTDVVLEHYLIQEHSEVHCKILYFKSAFYYCPFHETLLLLYYHYYYNYYLLFVIIIIGSIIICYYINEIIIVSLLY